VSRVVSQFEKGQENLPAGVEEVPAGAWNLAKVPEGVLLTVGEKCGAFEALLQRVAAELERDGVTGALDLYELPEVPRPPSLTDLVEARLRVNGERAPQGYYYRWAADREALWRVASAGARWCLRSGPDRGVTLQVRTLPPLPVSSGDDEEALLREVLESAESLGHVVLRSIGADRFRSLAVEPSKGRVTLLDGGSAIHADGWREAVAELMELLRAASPDLVYGFVKRGALTHEAEAGYSLARDWPQPQQPGSGDGEAFEDRYAPDAFGIQLLGPGFTDRLPAGTDWRLTRLEGERVLVEHGDPEAWFRGPRLEDALKGVASPDAELRTGARADFASTLFREEIAAEARSRRQELRRRRPDVNISDRLAETLGGFSSPLIGIQRVALVLSDGQVIEDARVAWGRVLVSVAGSEEFEIIGEQISDVLPRD
jgi:hypothetical protein